MERRQIHQNLASTKQTEKHFINVSKTLAMVWQTMKPNLAVINIMTNARANVNLAVPANLQTALPIHLLLVHPERPARAAPPAVEIQLLGIRKAAHLKIALVTL